ncbi:MAG: hypothetical protein GWN79_11595, partial [Actinobacteria bacterium]|nr:hypothetical protein [Actinomycetota bacterium]NIU19690.1 hypothetical protein [Actinomycetota bacterium]
MQNDQLEAGGRHGAGYVAHRADGYGIPGVVVDGNDVLEVAAVAREAVERARSGGGPTLIEAITSRPPDDEDSGDRDRWEMNDPIPRIEEYLGTRGLLDEQRRRHITERIESRIARTLEWARGQSEPSVSQLGTDLFALRSAPEAATSPSGELMTVEEALHSGLRDEMLRDERVFAIGAHAGGSGVTGGLGEMFGSLRVVATPAGAAALVGAAVGAALEGMRPVAEIAPI